MAQLLMQSIFYLGWYESKINMRSKRIQLKLKINIIVNQKICIYLFNNNNNECLKRWNLFGTHTCLFLFGETFGRKKKIFQIFIQILFLPLYEYKKNHRSYEQYRWYEYKMNLYYVCIWKIVPYTMPRAASHSPVYVCDMNKKKSIFSHSIFLCVW